MRISAVALALCLAAVAADGAAAAAARREFYPTYYAAQRQRPPSPWGVVPYGGGGDAPSSPSSSPSLSSLSSSSLTASSSHIQPNGEKDAGCEEAGSISAGTEESSSTRILNSVAAGGGSPFDTPAFVCAAKKSSPAQATTSTPKGAEQPASMADSVSSLSVATRKSAEAVEAASETDDGESGRPSAEGVRGGPLKILFLSSDTGGGHRASAEALANQFQRLFPGTSYDLMDVWSDVDSSWPYCTIRDTYKSFSATPWKWRALYHVSNSPLYAKFVDLHSYYMNEDLIREKMEEYDPDVVVSVHPTMNYVPLFSTRKISEKVGRDIPFFTVVTDFGSGHSTWFNKDVDRMYLASDPIKKIAQGRGGVPDEKIVMSGLPIRHDFARQADAMGNDRTTDRGRAHQAKKREELGIDQEKRMVLVMGGGEGVGSLSNIVDELYAKLRTQGVDATICVVCGRNDVLRTDLEERSWDEVASRSMQSYESLRSRFYTKVLSLHAHRSRRIQLALDRAAARAARGKDVADVPGNIDVVPLGFVTNMADWMVAADVLVSKAGPGTIAEAAAVGLPVMVTSHLPGQEAGNVDIVLNGGFGDFCEDPETIGLEVACWLQDPQLLDVMSQKATLVGHPHAAEEIAADIGEMTHQWMANERKRSEGHDSLT